MHAFIYLYIQSDKLYRMDILYTVRCLVSLLLGWM